ncbi:MAG: hypothetical protein IJ890_05630 [Clostridia bacterium]|nr:hypothetical protein [Clostridia bacterium]
MAKKQKQKQEIEIEEPTVIEEEEDNPVIKIKDIDTPKEIDNDDIPDELQSVIDECGADCSYTVGVFRYNDKTQQKEKVGTYQIAEFKPDMIAKTYGGGKYEYMVRVGNKLHRRLTTTYATAVVPEKPQVPTLQEIQTMMNNNIQKDENSNNVMMKMLELQQQQMTTLLTTLLANKPKEDDSFDKAIKMMSVLGVKNANNDIDKMLSVFQRGLDLSTKVSDLQATDEDDEDTGIITKLLKKVINSEAGADILQKLLAGKTVLPQAEQPTAENPLQPETIIQPQSIAPSIQQNSSVDIVKNFLNKHKKRILIEYNSKTKIEDLADFYYNGILIDDDLINAFTEVFLQDTTPLINDIPEFNEPNICHYVKSVLDKMKDMLYNNSTDNNEEVDTNDISTQENTDTE